MAGETGSRKVPEPNNLGKEYPAPGNFSFPVLWGGGGRAEKFI